MLFTYEKNPHWAYYYQLYLFCFAYVWQLFVSIQLSCVAAVTLKILVAPLEVLCLIIIH